MLQATLAKGEQDFRPTSAGRNTRENSVISLPAVEVVRVSTVKDPSSRCKTLISLVGVKNHDKHWDQTDEDE
jgi:hypothetical protein